MPINQNEDQGSSQGAQTQLQSQSATPVPASYQPPYYNDAQHAAVDGIAMIYRSPLRGPEMLELARGVLPIASLFQPEVMSATLIFRAARDLLKVRGGTYPEGRRMSARSAVVHMLAENEVEELVYNSSEQDWVARAAGATQNDGHQQSDQHSERDRHRSNNQHHNNSVEQNRKLGDSFARRFTMDESKFSGSATSDLNKVIGRFRDCLSDNLITEKESLKLAHTMFVDDAKRYYDELDHSQFKDIDNIKSAMMDRFLSPAAQSAISRELDNLSISVIMTRDKQGPRAALDKLHSTIVQKGPMGELNQRTDRTYGNFLRKAVISEPRARNAAEEFVTDDTTTFADLHQALTSAIITSEEIEAAKARAYADTSQSYYQTEDASSIFFGAQLGNHPSHGVSSSTPKPLRSVGQYINRSPTKSPSTPRSANRNSQPCFKCGKTGHWKRECRSNISTYDAAKARVHAHGNDQRAVAATLYELCSQVDEEAEDKAQDQPVDEFTALFIDFDQGNHPAADSTAGVEEDDQSGTRQDF